MKKRYYLPLISLCLIIPLLAISCLPVASTPTPAALSTVNKDVTELKTQLEELKQKNTGLQNQITELQNNKLSKSEYTGAANTYTKAEIDNKVKALDDRIEQVDDRIDTWTQGTGTTTTTTPTTPLSGAITITTSPTPLPQIYTSSGGSSTQNFNVSIYNGMSQWQYIKPIVTLSTVPGYSSTSVRILGPGSTPVGTPCVITLSSGAGTIKGTYGQAPVSGDASKQIQFSPNDSSISTSSLTAIPVYGGANGQGEFQIASGQTLLIWGTVEALSTDPGTLWSITVTYTNHSL